MPRQEVFTPSYIRRCGPSLSIHAGTSGHGTQEPVYCDQVRICPNEFLWNGVFPPKVCGRCLSSPLWGDICQYSMKSHAGSCLFSQHAETRRTFSPALTLEIRAFLCALGFFRTHHIVHLWWTRMFGFWGRHSLSFLYVHKLTSITDTPWAHAEHPFQKDCDRISIAQLILTVHLRSIRCQI